MLALGFWLPVSLSLEMEWKEQFAFDLTIIALCATYALLAIADKQKGNS